MSGPGQTPLSVMALDEFAGCSLCNAPAHSPNCQDTSQVLTGSPRGAGTQGFASCQNAFQVLPYMQLLKTRALCRGCPVEGLPRSHTYPVLSAPRSSSSQQRELAASPEHQHLCPSFFPGVLAQDAFVQSVIHSTGMPAELPASVVTPEGMRSFPSISHRCHSSWFTAWGNLTGEASL